MQTPAPAPARAPRASAPPAPSLPGASEIPGVPVADLSVMQGQLAELRVQQAGLRAQSSGLRRQLDNMLQSNPARPGVAQEWANVGVQLAQVDGAVAALQARISQKQGLSIERVTSTGSPFPPFRTGPDPDMVVGMSIGFLMLIGLPISLAYARRIWRGKPDIPARKVDEIAPRLDRLEQAVDSIAIEIERISEGQRFVTKIFSERPAQNQQAAEANSPRALGAGPIEQVRVSGREAIKESNY